MEFLSEIYYGNTLTDWCIAFAILLGSFIITKLFYWVFSNVIKKITVRTKSTVDDVLVNKLEKPIIYFKTSLKNIILLTRLIKRFPILTTKNQTF